MSEPNSRPGSDGTPLPGGFPQQPPATSQPPSAQPSSSQASSIWGVPNSAWNQSPGGSPATGHRQPAAPQPPPRAAQPGSPASSPGLPQLGTPASPRVSIDQYRTKRNLVIPIVLVVAVIAVITGVLYFGTRPQPLDGAVATPTPSRPVPSASVTPGRTANAIRFQTSKVSGTFTLNSSRWTGSTLAADVTVQVDTGSLDFWFVTMDVATGNVYNVTSPSMAGDIHQQTLRAGASASGTVRVDKPRGDTQLLLSDTNGDNLTMLLVSG